jgi:hypothetical protein
MLPCVVEGAGDLFQARWIQQGNDRPAGQRYIPEPWITGLQPIGRSVRQGTELFVNRKSRIFSLIY